MFGYIYKTTNLINGKIYVGKRQKSKFDSSYYGSGTIFKKALRKYGKNNFSVEILECCSCLNELNEKEIYWIAKLNAKDESIGYNLANGGSGNSGFHHTDEYKRKLSERIRGEKHPLYGKHHSEKTRRKLSDIRKNRNIKEFWVTNDIDEKLICVDCDIPEGFHKGRLGESVKKSAQSHRCKKVSDEIRRKMSNRLKGIHWYTDGSTDVMAKECPEGFHIGRTKIDTKGSKNPMYGKSSPTRGTHMSELSKSKLKNSLKKLNEQRKMVWYTNGVNEIWLDILHKNVPQGYYEGRLPSKLAHSVEILDTVSGETQSFESFYEASLKIGLSFTTIKKSCELGIPVKQKRYICKYINK